MVVSAAEMLIRENDRVLFIIVGGGKMENEIRRLVDSMRLEENVLFAGYIDNSILPEYYHASDAFAISSFYEGTCMVLLEAAGSSLPIVSTATAGAADAIIEGETGYTVPVGDDTMFARRLLELLDNPSKAKEMGRRGRVYVLEKFDKEKIVKDYVSMWEYAASKKRK